MKRFRLISFLVTSFLIGCIALTGCTTGTTDNQKLEEQVLQIIRDNPQVIIESVQAYQQQEENQMRAARQAFLQQMLTNPAAVIGNSPTVGAAEQKIVLVEFSDFQCPFCARAHQTIKGFMEKYKGEVTLTYKHLPLASIHPQAMPAAKAAWSAQQQGKFWEYYDALFEQQKDLGENLYVAIAENLNLDLDKFNRDRQSKEAEAAINQDVQLARQLGINGTPFFFLNEEAFSGALELPEIEQILAKVKQS
ncbi:MULTISPECIES: DsbA family protein [Planktothricoides]|uniref:DsbA family protein n=2 Tax=Planktothricoides raciborskii TaxID=132608 RepID=A0AAU8JJF1_9CYAN|nr:MULTISPECIES: DsbA family protein [Planktothricoides]KOR38115.1 disulfide bond formation protein DsbA [Planktothricoides sp. SR001]MBD2542576.1 DsbA family protein [Planktothricoides raciborskii FACHB-1370]MBD2581034.1 DsbA family protein [Planktothricoides raciborskii FACHB-1261]